MLVYEIAFCLGKTVYELERDMPYEEFLGWINYFKVRPVGWREDSRVSMLLQAQGVKTKPENLFESLRQMKINAEPTRLQDTLRSSGLLAKLMTVAHENKIEWEIEDA